MSNQIPIFCINLDRAKERKQRIQKEWIDGLGFDIQFWKAYDRRDIEKREYVYKYDSEKTKQNLNRELSTGEIACATSFAMLYEFAISNNFEEIIVMEDDISPKINDKNMLFDYINQGKEEFPDSEFMVLQGRSLKQKHMYIDTKLFFSKINPVPYGNLLLYLNKSAILKVYNLLNTMMYPADNPHRILFYNNKLEVIVSNLSLTYHNTTTTYIGNDLRLTKRNFIT